MRYCFTPKCTVCRTYSCRATVISDKSENASKLINCYEYGNNVSSFALLGFAQAISSVTTSRTGSLGHKDQVVSGIIGFSAVEPAKVEESDEVRCRDLLRLCLCLLTQPAVKARIRCVQTYARDGEQATQLQCLQQEARRHFINALNRWALTPKGSL